jgi:hypothetical protein
MFSTTFLGHQGWVFRTERATVLVDPLLCEDFGQLHALDYRVWPPRHLDLAKLGPVDAVVLSHEHDDHFDIPSLAKLDRKLPIYLSSRSSIAATSILATMGFTVHPLVPGVPTVIGDLEVTPFVGDHRTANTGDEWDTLPYLVRHTGGHGSFFTTVDVPLTELHVQWAARIAARPGLIGWTNNAIDWAHMAAHLAGREEGTQQAFVKMGMCHKMIEQQWGSPLAMMICAGGFSFVGDREWLNRRVFCVDTEAVCALIAKVYRKERFLAARPGQTFNLIANKLRSIEETAPFLAAAPRDSWPVRGWSADRQAPDYAPATGRRAFPDADLPKLAVALDELAAALFTGNLFKNLSSLLDSEVGDRKLAFALSLRREMADSTAEALVFEYVPTSCTFVRADAAIAARDRYLGGLECWASDFFAVLGGELGPIALTFARARVWNALPERFHFDPFAELFRVSHPLRRPAATLRTYERAWQALAGTDPVVHSRPHEP